MKQNAVLGISAFGHDTSACVVNKTNGEVIYAVAEERLTNVKHDSHLPIGSINHCINYANKNGFSISEVAINVNEIEFLRTLESEINNLINDDRISHEINKFLFDAYEMNEYYFIGTKTKEIIDEAINRFKIESKIKRTIKKRISCYFNWAIKYRQLYHIVRDMFPEIRVHKINHHLSHSATAYLNSGFDEATIIVMDGQGESDTVSIFIGKDSKIERISTTTWPCSLGVYYLMSTYHLGFKLGDEYKVMGMAAYGKPVYYDILSQMISVNENAQLVFNETEYFEQKEMETTGHVYYNFNNKFKKVVPERRNGKEIKQEHFDFAASVQKLTENLGISIAIKAMNITGIKNIAIAGGVGLNGLMNEKIRKYSGCNDVFIYPASGDDGGSVGAAQYICFKETALKQRDRIKTCYYGYEATHCEMIKALNNKQLIYTKPTSIHIEIAKALSQNKIVARYIGKSEFGPRALGNRSILASASTKEMKDILNRRIKQREPFRPFAPACLRERVDEYFDINIDAPFMLLICQATDKAKAEIPAVVHNDGTCRMQTVTFDQNEDYYNIISEFEKITGVPVIINTSFNVNGETIVDTPLDAVESFGFMDIDYLAIGDYWVSKEENKDKFPKLSHKEYLALRHDRFKEKFNAHVASIDVSYNNIFFEPNIHSILLRLIKSKARNVKWIRKMASLLR